MIHVRLTDEDKQRVRALTETLSAKYVSASDPSFLEAVSVIAHDLPATIRFALNELRVKEPDSGLCVISGYPVDFERIGKTPSHWQVAAKSQQAREEEFYLMLVGSLLGDVFAWATQQDGRLVHDVLPIRQHEWEQLGCGSRELLWWHNEDAFHPYRADYLALMCLRNPDRVPTTVSWLEKPDLDETIQNTLSQYRFVILPDESHLEKNRAGREPALGDLALTSAYEQINKMRAAPERVAVLDGTPTCRYIRLDPYFMPRLTEDQEAQAALDRLIGALEQRLQDLVMQPGDTCIIDNYKAVHGRKPFIARYDGNDRWLKRINITRDLRKSSKARGGASARTIF